MNTVKEDIWRSVKLIKPILRIINRKKKLPEDKEPDLLEIKKKSHPENNQTCLKERRYLITIIYVGPYLTVNFCRPDIRVNQPADPRFINVDTEKQEPNLKSKICET